MKKLLLTAVVLAAASTSAHAGSGGSNYVGTLQDLTDGTITGFTVNDKVFSGFSALNTGSLDLTQIGVYTYSAGGEYGFTLNGSLTGTGDLGLGYTVATASGAKLIDDATLISAGGATGDGSWNVGETYTNGGQQVGSGLTVGYNFGNAPLVASETFAPVSSLTVAKDIGWSSNIGAVDLSIITQAFSEVPGPVPGVGFAGLAALALAGLYTRARRA